MEDTKLTLLNEVFSPATPIQSKDLFYGRYAQLERIVDSINQRGQHAIVYGERGVGKTSLANIMHDSITNLYPVTVTCNRSDSFKTLWVRAFSDVKTAKTTKGIGFKPQVKEEIEDLGKRLSNHKRVTPDLISKFLSQFRDLTMLFIFDEFDNINNNAINQAFADLIKSLSDNAHRATIVLVGIASNIEDLIGSHPSLDRCLKQIKMPLMSPKEASEIIDIGLEKLEITITDPVKNKILSFYSGFPHYVHLLCYHGAKELISNKKNDFNSAYLRIAIKKGIEDCTSRLHTAYQKATNDTRSGNASKWVNVLHACAICDVDEYNLFTTSQVLKEYNELTNSKVKGDNLRYNLNALCSEERGFVIKKIGKGKNTKLRFMNPMMRAYVKLKIEAIKN